MKKLTAFFSALAFLLGTSAFAAPTDISKEIETAFKKNFTTAANVTWEKTSDIYVANFEIDNMNVNAAYNENGELLGIARKVSLSQLPMSVSQAFKTQYDGYTLRSYATEIVFDGQTNYYLTAERDSRMYNLKCSPDGLISIEKRSKKKILVGKVL